MFKTWIKSVQEWRYGPETIIEEIFLDIKLEISCYEDSCNSKQR